MGTTTYTGSETWDTSIEVPDDAEKGISALAAALESLRDSVVWLKAKTPFGVYACLSDTITSLVTTSASTYTGADDYELLSGVYDVTSGEDVIVDLQCMVFMTTGVSNAGEYRLAYAIGAGAKTAIPGSVREYGLMTNNKVPMSIRGSFTAAAAGDLKIYLQARAFGGGTVNAYAPFHGTVEVRTIDT
jgi:hypothetical protein